LKAKKYCTAITVNLLEPKLSNLLYLSLKMKTEEIKTGNELDEKPEKPKEGDYQSIEMFREALVLYWADLDSWYERNPDAS
jgi:hypothetical protein